MPIRPVPDVDPLAPPAPRALPVWATPFQFPSAAASELFNTANNGNPLDIDRLAELPWSSDPADRLSAAFMTLAVQRRFAIVPDLLGWGVSPNALRFDPRTAGRQRRPNAPLPTPVSVLSEALLAAPARVVHALLDAGATPGYWAESARDPLMIVVQAPRPMWIDHDAFRDAQVERFDALRARGFAPWPETLVQGVVEAVASSVSPAIVERLVAMGADPHARRHGNRTTALHLAAWEPGRSALVELLLALGVDPSARDDQERTPLKVLEDRLARTSFPSETDRVNLARLQGLELRRHLDGATGLPMGAGPDASSSPRASRARL